MLDICTSEYPMTSASIGALSQQGFRAFPGVSELGAFSADYYRRQYLRSAEIYPESMLISAQVEHGGELAAWCGRSAWCSDPAVYFLDFIASPPNNPQIMADLVGWAERYATENKGHSLFVEFNADNAALVKHIAPDSFECSLQEHWYEATLDELCQGGREVTREKGKEIEGYSCSDFTHAESFPSRNWRKAVLGLSTISHAFPADQLDFDFVRGELLDPIIIRKASYFVFQGDTIAAMIICTEDTLGNVAEVRFAFVREDHRNQGLLKRLYSLSFETLRRNGYERVRILRRKQHKRAQKVTLVDGRNLPRWSYSGLRTYWHRNLIEESDG